MKISLKQLEVFIAVAKEGNMSRAAINIHLSQPACSMALAELENSLEGSLFDRKGKQLILNDRGRLLLPRAMTVISEVREISDVLASNEEKIMGHLIVGASTTIGNYLLPQIVGNFINTHQKTKISLQIGNTQQIIEKLLRFDIDLGMIEGNCNVNEIEVIPWRIDKLLIVASSRHSLAKKRKIKLQDLLDTRWILRESGSGTREKFEEAIGYKIEPFLELEQTEAIKQAVQAGLGISCLSEITVSEALKSKKLIELKTPFLKLTREFYILRHKEKYHTMLLGNFITHCSNF